jgi:hypothetical protein
VEHEFGTWNKKFSFTMTRTGRSDGASTESGDGARTPWPTNRDGGSRESRGWGTVVGGESRTGGSGAAEKLRVVGVEDSCGEVLSGDGDGGGVCDEMSGKRAACIMGLGSENDGGVRLARGGGKGG